MKIAGKFEGSIAIMEEMFKTVIIVKLIPVLCFRTVMTNTKRVADDTKGLYESATDDVRATYNLRNLYGFTRLMDQAGNSDLSPVLDTIEHALLSQNPKSRYVPARKDFLFAWFLTTIPIFLRDKFTWPE